MGKEYSKQHVVPKRYLDRFATLVDGKHLIGTRYHDGKNVRLFLESTIDVGYEKNCYDVTDKEDPKFWEHFFNREIDTLCGPDMERIISSVTLSQSGHNVLTDYDKEILSKLIVAQMMRVPSSFDYAKKIYPRVEREVKDDAISVLPISLKDKLEPIINNIKLDEQWQREQFLNLVFAPENFGKYCELVKNRIWTVLVNNQRNTMPFTTSDNPVLIEGIGKKEIGLFNNGLANPETCIFFPLSPSIAIASYSKYGIMNVAADELDGKKHILNEINYIMDKNVKIMDQARRHSFIPQPLFDELIKKE